MTAKKDNLSYSIIADITAEVINHAKNSITKAPMAKKINNIFYNSCSDHKPCKKSDKNGS